MSLPPYLLAQLDCGCIITIGTGQVGSPYFDCPHCGDSFKVFAIESREWTNCCKSCSYKRYWGQSEANSSRAASQHNLRTGHETYLGYESRDAITSLIRTAYPRQCKVYIKTNVKPPKIRYVYKEHHGPDIPPF